MLLKINLLQLVNGIFGSAISLIIAAIMMVCMYAIRKIDERNSGGSQKL